MRKNLTALERASELARSGTCHNIFDIYLQLKTEGYSLEQLQGPLVKAQLRHLIDMATRHPRN